MRLSLSQREVWLDQRAWPESAHLNIGGGAYLEGELDLARFQRALACLVEENQALRLAPLSTGKQVLLERVAPALEIVDLSGSPDPRKAMRLWWQARIREPFVLDGAPPWRFTLLRGGERLHGLTIQFHHIIMDGWGTTQVMRRWSEIHNALGEGGGAGCPDSGAPPYTRFIAESHAYKDSEHYQGDASYWRGQVPVLPPPLIERRYAGPNGGSNGGQPAGQLPQSRLVEQRIARADYARLEAHAGEQGLTPFNYVLAALALYFARVNNVHEVVVGVPSLNRGGRVYKSTLGMFAGVLAVKIAVPPGISVAELLASTKTAMRGALRHPRYPLSELGRELEVIRQGRDGLLDIFLSFERQDYTLAFGDAALVDARQLFSGIARYPLGVTVCEFHAEQDLELILDASESCFAPGEAELLGRRLWALVEAMRAMPGADVAALSIVPNEEQWAVLYGLHRDIASHDNPPPFITLFEHQVALRPEATALVWDDGSIDYATLNRRANLLAQRLLSLGAGRGKVLAMSIGRTPAMVVALLAIAKTGAAFLPLDPDAPVERLADILEQSEACALLIEPSAGGRLGQLHANIVRVRWNDPLADLPDPAPANPQSAPAPGDLAYVLFTSGSTGRPKGVMVEHAVLSRRLAWLSRAWGIDWQDCAGQSTQYTFDPSLVELLLPLIQGARIALPPPGRLLPESLAEFAVRHGVTFMAFVPSTLSRFLDGAAGLQGLKMRVCCCGGEVLSPALARRFVAETGARLYNVYGPTEAAIFATAWQCGATGDDGPLPIGRPIDDTRIYVLDEQLRAMPLGIPGEIYIAGDTLARGYLNRPELDSAVFLDDPFQPGGRMYRTGDRGWLGVEGNLHFVGRLDRQVKLRGYRIELGEIEAACLNVSGVNQAAARLVDFNGKPQIHAWVGAADGVTAQRLQGVLRQRLPDYMIPSAISVLPSLAESSVGKTDYDALPAQQPGEMAAQARAPGTAMERELVAIWEGALAARPIGIHDNFFDIGGDSLAAVSILASIDTLLGCKVPMYTLTEHPTIERLAVALGRQITPPDTIIPLGADNGRTPLYLAASGHGDLMRFQDLARRVSDTYDVYMLQPPADRPVKTVQELAELYVNCILAQGREPGVLAGFSVGGVAALETARLLRGSGTPVRTLVLLDTIHPHSFVGGVRSWRLLGWLVRTLRVQELSMNGRRLGALVNDPGLVGQVMALRGFRPGAFDGHTCLIRSSGLANWDRVFFGKWRRLMNGQLTERRVPGLHGSIFEAPNVDELAIALSSVATERHALN
ncbi:non-ribosomal peptide synthetase [Pseudoduganella namucuonensis]|uniref:non-ribosomal peptide synthetase n=1 Tax=Pseudoduganella namucuonensis TaxID=1035707 RepID=UPI0015A56832|nr:non-ribosomal peptide synthetase [Pseudoduganella namucuonensis]